MNYRISSGELSYADVSKKLIFRQQIITTNTSDCGYFLDGKYFFYSDKEGNKNFIDVAKNKITKIFGFVGHPDINLYDGKKFIAHEYIDLVEGQRQLISYNLSKKTKTILRKDISFGIKILISNGLIITEGKTILKSLSLLTGKYDWEVDLAAYGDIIKVLAVEHGFLWVLLRKKIDTEKEYSDTCTILGINPADGTIEHHLARTDLNCHNILFSEDKKTLICTSYRNGTTWLVELDLPDLSVKREVLLQDVHEANLNIVRFIIKDGLLYFIAEQKGSFRSQYLGVLKLETLKLLWHKRVIETNAGFNGPPQVGENKIYVLDTDGTLYIYEREESLKRDLKEA